MANWLLACRPHPGHRPLISMPLLTPILNPGLDQIGCFWGRQKDFIETEKRLGRPESQVSALVGYAGGVEPSRSGKVCYFSGPPDTHYDALGHAEVSTSRN